MVPEAAFAGHVEPFLGWAGLTLPLLSHLGCSVGLRVYLLCPLKGLGDKLVNYVPRQNSHLFSHLEPFTHFFTSYWFLLGFWFWGGFFCTSFFLWYLTLATPITHFMQPLPRYRFLLLPALPPCLVGDPFWPCFPLRYLCPSQVFLPVSAESSGPIFHVLL